MIDSLISRFPSSFHQPSSRLTGTSIESGLAMTDSLTHFIVGMERHDDIPTNFLDKGLDDDHEAAIHQVLANDDGCLVEDVGEKDHALSHTLRRQLLVAVDDC